ncbi:MAG: hypothetical protein AAB922_04130 [Patescibacteria group bacterium]|mgnify:CR=1 FL=1
MIGPLRWLVIAYGVFLILDAMFFKLLFFAYEKIGLGAVDPYFSHAIWGILLIVVALTVNAGGQPIK